MAIILAEEHIPMLYLPVMFGLETQRTDIIINFKAVLLGLLPPT